jgi:diaminopimelate decarboxylase
MEQVHRTSGFVTRELNIGGGFGVRYTDEDDVKPFSYFLDPVMELLEEGCTGRGLVRPDLVIEPGRSMVANAGATLYRVGAVKEIPGIRTYVSVDGGMTDNIRTALYDSKYEVLEGVQKACEPETVTLCGKCCESGDILVHDARLCAPARGDLLAVAGTGAYCLPMASNYNKIPHLAVVLVSRGVPRLIVARQSYREMVSREL